MQMPAPAPILLLGVFHFAHQLDRYKPQHNFDVFSERRQAEIEDLVAQLARFQPTKIGIERNLNKQGEIDAEYKAYVEGTFELSADEIHQIGFRLAKRLQHERVYCINAWDRYYEPAIDLEAFLLMHALEEAEALFEPDALEAQAERFGQTHLLNQWWPTFVEEFKQHDETIDQKRLIEILREGNTEASLLRSHGMYLVDRFKIGSGHNYAGADWTTHWFNRNLRIFANIQRITQPADRILVLIGAGHVPLLRHCAQASPEYELSEAGAYLSENVS
jgi:hypothetical protein